LSVFEPVPLGDVVIQARSGGTPSRTRDDFYGGNIPWLKSGEVENDRITTASEFITQAGLKESSAWVVPPGSTVVAMYGQGTPKEELDTYQLLWRRIRPSSPSSVTPSL